MSLHGCLVLAAIDAQLLGLPSDEHVTNKSHALKTKKNKRSDFFKFLINILTYFVMMQIHIEKLHSMAAKLDSRMMIQNRLTDFRSLMRIPMKMESQLAYANAPVGC